MRKDVLPEEIKELVSNILRDNAAEPVDITYKREGAVRILRILADKEGGITIDECAKLNRIISDTMDKEGFIDENYVLEISSPGLDRPLKTKKDFLRLKGKKIHAYTYEPIDGKREIIGVLEGVEGDNITIFDKKAKLTKVPLNKISKATFDYKSLV